MAQKFLSDIHPTAGIKDTSGDLGSSGQVLSSTGAGTNWVNQEDGATVIYNDAFTATANQTVFTLSNSVDTEDKTQIYIDGAYQSKLGYTVNGTTLTFDTGLDVGSKVEVMTFASTTASNAAAVIRLDEFTGNNSTTDFVLAQGVTDEKVTQVYINGVYQHKDTYSITDVTLTFSTAPPTSADIEVITFDTLSSSGEIQASSTALYVKNTSGSTIDKGIPVYITGSVGNSNTLTISPANASNASHMPSTGLLLTTLTNNSFGYIITNGFLKGLTTNTIDGTSTSSNDTIYVKAGGGLTMTKPTGTNLIQNIGKVARSSGGNSGSILVSSILRSNDVPNIASGKIWVGDSNAVATERSLSGDATLSNTGALTLGTVPITKGGTGATSASAAKTALSLDNLDNTSDANKPVSTAGQAALDLKSNIAGPTFTGVPAAPTASAGTNTTQLATTAFVTTGIANIVDSSPGALNTLNELAAALGDDANFSTTVTNSIATKLPLAGGTLTGDVTFSGNVLIGTNINSDIPLQVNKETASSGTAIAFLRNTDAAGNGLVVDVTTPQNYVADFRIGNVSKMRISSGGDATFSGKSDITTSVSGFASTITNNKDDSQGLLVRTSDNDGGEYILDLQSSSSATGTNYASKFKVAKGGDATFSGNVSLADTKYIQLNNTSTDWQLRADNAGKFIIQTSGGSEFFKIRNNGEVAFGNGTAFNQFFNVRSSSTSQSLINIGTSDNSETLNVGVLGSAGYVMMENSAALNIGTGGVTRMSISSGGDTTLTASYSGNTFPFRVGYLSGSTYTPTFSINDNGETTIMATSTSGLILAQAGQSYYHKIRNQGDGLYIGVDDGGQGGAGADLRINIKGSEKMRIASGGQVAIGTGTNTTKFRVLQSANGEWTAQFINTGTQPYGISIDTSANSSNAYSFAVYTNSNTGLFVKNDARVGIGTTNPSSTLHVSGTIKADASATANNPLIVVSDTGGGLVTFQRSSAYTQMYMASTTSGNQFYVRSQGSGGVVLATGGTSWGNGSDARLKKNFETTQGLSEVLQIEPIKYHLKTQDNSETKKLGFKAQNLQTVIPEMILDMDEEDPEDGSKYLGIIPDYLFPVLVKAIQEQQTIIEDLKSRIETLEG